MVGRQKRMAAAVCGMALVLECRCGAQEDAQMTKPYDPTVVREALGSGRWFPDKAADLKNMVTSFIDGADVATLPRGRIAAVLSPHAGYVYSGKVAGHSFRALAESAKSGHAPETVVIIGFTHRGSFPGVALMDGDAIHTPLGETDLDKEAVSRLVKFPRIRTFYGPHAGEHSAENQVPFVQAALPAAKLVVALIGDHENETITSLVDALTDLSTQKQIVVVASTDLLHDSDHDLVTKTDHQTLDAIVSMSTDELAGMWSFSNQVCCGIGPVLTAMRFAAGQGCTGGTLLSYRNSGDDYPESRGQWVVGYGAVAFSVDP